MNKRRELKALLLAGIATLTLMSGCSKSNNEETRTPEKAYYMIIGDEYVEIENVKSVGTPSYCGTYTRIEFNDGTTMTIPISNLYIMDKTSEQQQDLIKKLTKEK